MKDRKQVYELTPADLARIPVWEFVHLAPDDEYADNIDTQDEATVRPYMGSLPLDGSDGMFAVRARFVLADGSRMTGFLTPDTDGSGLGTIQPSIVTERGHASFWCGGIKPSAEDKAQTYAMLDRQAREVFPIRFESDVDLVGGPTAGEIHGFLFYDDKDDEKVIIET